MRGGNFELIGLDKFGDNSIYLQHEFLKTDAL
jgi:hypothetical protein